MLGFSDQENEALFKYFDIDGSGSVDYDEFLR
jgi:Ca2+-binding EF-hand superfamily protein